MELLDAKEIEIIEDDAQFYRRCNKELSEERQACDNLSGLCYIFFVTFGAALFLAGVAVEKG